MTRLEFTTPINQGASLHGTLTVHYQGNGQHITITRVTYTQAYHSTNKADVTYLVQQYAPVLWRRLMDMARNNFINTSPESTN